VIKKKISQEDVVAWKKYTDNPTDVIDKEKNQKKSFKNQRFKYDLHGFSLLDANKIVKKVIKSCVEKDYTEILLITGKGIHSNTDQDIYVSKDLSKLRYSVPDYIASSEDISKYVSSVQDAKKEDGGEGALLIKLKKL